MIPRSGERQIDPAHSYQNLQVSLFAAADDVYCGITTEGSWRATRRWRAVMTPTVPVRGANRGSTA